MKIIITEKQYNILLETDYRKVLDSNLIKDKVTIDVLAKKYPQWDFSRARIRREKNSKGQTYRFLDGLNCPKHGLSDNLNVSDLDRRGSGCRECGKEKQIEKGFQKTEVNQWIIDLDKVGFSTEFENFEYMSNKKGKPVLFVKDAICKECGGKIKKYLNVWNMKSGKSVCPNCSLNKWKGEEKVKTILDKLNINYIPKYQFPDLKGKEHIRKTPTGFSKPIKLPYYFDFYLPEKNTLIEYDGQYHFDVKKDRHDEIKLSDYIRRDLEKNKYCKDNDIKLIRIPYTSKNVDQIEKEIVDGLNSEDMLVTTGNYPKKGWNK
jgi:hypothetical protein